MTQQAERLTSSVTAQEPPLARLMAGRLTLTLPTRQVSQRSTAACSVGYPDR
jgi:hypothetical protein